MRRPVIGLALTMVLATGLVACPAPSSTNPGVSASPGSSASPSPAESSSTELQGFFDAGDGRELWISCTGSGGPTIILQAAAGSDDFPAEFRDALAEETTTCVYDRAGSGTSAGVPEPETMAGVVDDLAGLLEAAQVPGPYLLVGWSLGGQILLQFALTHEADTAGLVILDTAFPSVDRTRDPLGVLLTEEEYQFLLEDDAWAQATLAETVALLRPLPDMPIRVLTATQPDVDCWPGRDAAFCAELSQLNIDFQADWVTYFPNAVRVLIDSDHSLPWTAPDDTLDQIQIALDESRGQ